MRVDKSWGYELIHHNGEYCCKQLVYTKPIASSMHYHSKKHETFVIAEGEFEIEVNGVKMKGLPGGHIVLPPFTAHRVRCIRPGVIFEASTPDDPSDCTRLIPSE